MPIRFYLRRHKDANRYTGAELRILRAERGVGPARVWGAFSDALPYFHTRQNARGRADAELQQYMDHIGARLSLPPHQVTSGLRLSIKATKAPASKKTEAAS